MKLALALAVSLFVADSKPQILQLEPTDARVDVENVAVENGTVTGTLLNQTDTAVRSVTLLVQHRYRWPNEYKPGATDPGRAESLTVTHEIPARGRITFSEPTAQPAPLGDGGHFETTVSVMAFEQIYPPASPAQPPSEIPAQEMPTH